MTKLTVAGSIEIQQPLNRVFDFVSDMTNDGLWRRDIDGMIAVTDQPPGVGQVFREKVGLLSANVQVTAFNAGSVMRCHASFLFGLLHVEIINRFEQAGQGTRLHKRLEFSIRHFDWLLKPILKRRLAKPDILHLESLKKILEQ